MVPRNGHASHHIARTSSSVIYIKMDENSMDGQPSRQKLCAFQSCTLKVLNKDGDFAKIHDKPVNVVVWSDSDTQCSVDIQDGST